MINPEKKKEKKKLSTNNCKWSGSNGHTHYLLNFRVQFSKDVKYRTQCLNEITENTQDTETTFFLLYTYLINFFALTNFDVKF